MALPALSTCRRHAQLALWLLGALLAACSSSESGSGGDADLGTGGELGPCPAGCPTGSYCAEDRACHTGCGADGDCADGQLCDLSTHQCGVHVCLVDSHCPASAPRCFPAADRCGCGQDADCAADQRCGPRGWCVPEDKECSRDAHCPSGQTCLSSGWCVRPGLECRLSSQCAEGEHCTGYGFCLPAGRDCDVDSECGPAEHCSDYGFCAPRGLDCRTTEQCPVDHPCNAAGYCVSAGRECELDLHCATGSRCDDASGVCVPTAESCVRQGCPDGQSCNRFGLCAPTGAQCATDEHCPGEQVCRGETGFCVPAGLSCNDDEDCGDPLTLSCNSFGSCVSTEDALVPCRPCLVDSECASPTAICLDGRFRDAAGQPATDQACLALCRQDGDCPAGLACTGYTFDARPFGLCRPRATSCTGWAAWEQPCAVDLECGTEALCRDLLLDLELVLQCTWRCSAEDDCPGGANCDARGLCSQGAASSND